MFLQIALLFIAVLYPSCDLENGWNGLQVFKSTRLDVEKILGKPTEEAGGDVWYENDGARFRFLFSAGPCVDPDSLRGGFKSEKGIILQYDVYLKKIETIGEAHVDLKLFKRTDDPESLQIAHYVDDRDAVSITALKMSEDEKEFIQTIYYNRTAEQVTKFSCAK